VIENPPWADRALKENWDLLEEFSEANDLPLPSKPRRGHKFEELGCGHYGCVLPTDQKGTVFKLTSDTTESRFIQHVMPLGWPDGIVQYYGIIELPFSFRRRSVSALWREEAFDVGGLSRYHQEEELSRWEERERNRFITRLEQFKEHAGRARDMLKRSKDRDALWAEAQKFTQWAWDNIGADDAEGKTQYGGRRSYLHIERFRGARKLAASWRACEIIAELMEHEHLSDSVGGALSFYLENKMLLADVHLGNIGKVRRIEEWDGGSDERELWVITDPGHTVIVEG